MANGISWKDVGIVVNKLSGELNLNMNTVFEDANSLRDYKQ